MSHNLQKQTRKFLFKKVLQACQKLKFTILKRVYYFDENIFQKTL